MYTQFMIWLIYHSAVRKHFNADVGLIGKTFVLHHTLWGMRIWTEVL